MKILQFQLSLYFLCIFLSPSTANLHIPELLGNLFSFPKDENIVKKSPSLKELKEVCDEKQLILQLARLYITSPERIVLLLSSNSLKSTCVEALNVLDYINKTVSECLPLPDNNLYMRLYNGLEYFNKQMCLYNMRLGENHLKNYHECFVELHEDLLDCEGPPDWFEKSNAAVVCEYYNDIINCNYIKAALLCGLKPAMLLRTFSSEIMKRVLTFKCKVSRSLPHVDDPMPARSGHLKFLNMFMYIILSLSYFIIIYILY